MTLSSSLGATFIKISLNQGYNSKLSIFPYIYLQWLSLKSLKLLFVATFIIKDQNIGNSRVEVCFKSNHINPGIKAHVYAISYIQK